MYILMYRHYSNMHVKTRRVHSKDSATLSAGTESLSYNIYTYMCPLFLDASVTTCV